MSDAQHKELSDKLDKVLGLLQKGGAAAPGAAATTKTTPAAGNKGAPGTAAGKAPGTTTAKPAATGAAPCFPDRVSDQPTCRQQERCASDCGQGPP